MPGFEHNGDMLKPAISPLPFLKEQYRAGIIFPAFLSGFPYIPTENGSLQIP